MAALIVQKIILSRNLHKIRDLLTSKLMQKRDWKNIGNSKSFAKAFILIRHLGSIHHF
jgi:hypothetical protein